MSNVIVTAQLPDKETIPVRLDTIQIKNNILNFTRLIFNKSQSGIDSIVNFCLFPFYNKDWQGKKIFNSASELKVELNEIFKKEEYKPVEYNTSTLYESALCENEFLKSKQYTCFKMTTYILNIGKENNSAILRTIFYVEKNFPFRILGVEED